MVAHGERPLDESDAVTQLTNKDQNEMMMEE